MRLEAVGNGRLRIWLTHEELQRWGIHSEALGSSRRQTEKLLRHILPAIRRRPQGRGHLTVEAIPVEGGCVLLVGGSGPALPGGPLLCRFDRLEDLYALAELWPAADESAPASPLYELGEAYLLVLYPVQALSLRQQRLLREYSRPVAVGEAAAAAVAEHGCLLAAGHALEQLLISCAPASPAPPDPAH